jgi:tRNA threonylcarbamoyladenosine biosynthesis protein TsaE
MGHISKNTAETGEIAKIFLNKLKPQKNEATVVGLFGELGTGKTTFTQFIAKELGVKRKVNSPTFMIMKKYRLLKQNSRKDFLANKTKPVSAGENLSENFAFKLLFHLDAYRLRNEKELLSLGWDEIIGNEEHLVFIEWPEHVIKALPKKHHQIHITHTKEGHREFKIKKT